MLAMPLLFMSTGLPIRLARAWLLLLIAIGNAGFALGQAVEEDAMKGAYLHSIFKFVDWPEDKRNPAQGNFQVCVLGSERLSALASALAGKTQGERPIVVSSLSDKTGRECQVIFISASEAWRGRSLIAELADSPILTIGETAGFARSGGMIEFILSDSRLKFEINQAATLRAHLAIKSQLLQLAIHVYK